MDRSKIRPLKPIRFRTRPLTSHALSWSPDADLAVATSETVYILFPEYPRDAQDTGDKKDAFLDQFHLRLELTGLFHPYHAVNAQLCAFAGVKLPPPGDESESEDEKAEVPEFRSVTGRGGSVSQVVRVEWSPVGLGACLRPILVAMTTNGELLAFGEHRDPEFEISSANSSRNTRMWKILWALGAGMPIPAEDYEGSYRTMDERITSFSWAKYTAPGKALLAYKTDVDEIVIMSVHYFQKPGSVGQLAVDFMWQIREVARFEATGPHEATDYFDDDFTPSGSAFALRWSPWVASGQTRTCQLAYVAPNYVGFRRVTVTESWETGREPKLEVGEADSVGICVSLQLDAFVEWEDMVWDELSSSVARGVICSPFEVHPFQVDLLSDEVVAKAQHATSECDTSYPRSGPTDPITSLIVHFPESLRKPTTPLYSLVRSSVTASSTDWFETNVPQTPEALAPSWINHLHRVTHRLVPRTDAVDVPDVDSDPDETDDEVDDAEGSGLKVHPYRFRIWAMASSPGGGSTAALVSKHSTQYPSRSARCRLIFDELATKTEVPHERGLTTEGKMWEWMYGNGADVPGVTVRNEDPSLPTPLRDFFKPIKEKQMCWLCESGLQDVDNEAKCLNGHSVALCSSTGLAILAPGTSRVCAVCRRRCLRESELRKLVAQHEADISAMPPLAEACGSCGGKFVA